MVEGVCIMLSIGYCNLTKLEVISLSSDECNYKSFSLTGSSAHDSKSETVQTKC